MKEIRAIQPQLHPTLADEKLQLAVYTATGRLVDKRKSTVAAEVLPEYQELRQQAHDLKRHAIEHLDYYLEEFERNLEARGGKVVWCRDGKDVVDFVLSLAKRRQSKVIVKSKSMTTEEIHLNDHLEEHGLEPVETDLGEYILQLKHDTPYHIVAPALHMTRYQWRTCLKRSPRSQGRGPREANADRPYYPAPEVSGSGYRDKRREFPAGRFRIRGSGGERGQRAALNHRPQGTYCNCRRGEGDPPRAGSRDLSEAARAERHRTAIDGLHLHPERAAARHGDRWA